MPLPVSILVSTVTIKRRASTGRDSLNNPIYGAPTSGAGWSTVYSGIQCRLALQTKQVRFAPEGERILPTGVVYFNPGITLLAEDRIITSDGIEYNIISVINAPGPSGVTDHIECVIQLP